MLGDPAGERNGMLEGGGDDSGTRERDIGCGPSTWRWITHFMFPVLMLFIPVIPATFLANPADYMRKTAGVLFNCRLAHWPLHDWAGFKGQDSVN